MIPNNAGTELVLASAVLALVRPAALMLVVPFFGMRMSVAIRIAVAFPVALMGFPLVLNQLAATSAPVFVIGTHELLVGVALGLAVTVLLTIGQFAGGMLDGMMPGWRASSILPGDPGPATATLALATLVIFATLDGHALVFEALLRSWQLMPATAQLPDHSLLTGLFTGTIGVFAISVAAVLPLLIALAIAEIALGLSVRFAGWQSQSLPLVPILALLFLLLGCYVFSSHLIGWLLEAVAQLASTS